MTNPAPEAIASEILRQATARGPDKSICPSEVARALAGGDEAAWRPLMGKVRQAAVALAGPADGDPAQGQAGAAPRTCAASSACAGRPAPLGRPA